MKYIYQNIKVLISKQYTLLIIMSSINLVYMHYCIISSNMLELPLDSTSFFDILLGVVFDTSIIYLFACLLSWGNTKSATAITFFITSIWAIINIIYSHFFNNYITLSAIKQSTSILDPLVIKSTINSIEYKNLFFIVFIHFLLTVSQNNYPSIEKNNIINLFDTSFYYIMRYGFSCVVLPLRT